MEEQNIVTLDPDHQGELIEKMKQVIAEQLSTAGQHAINSEFRNMQEEFQMVTTNMDLLVRIATNSCTMEDLDLIDCL